MFFENKFNKEKKHNMSDQMIRIHTISNCNDDNCLDNNEDSVLLIKKERKLNLPLDLSFRDLKHIRLPQDLSKYDLVGSDLSGQDFSFKKLPNNIKHANLKNVDLRKAKFKDFLNLSFSNLKGAKLPRDLSKFILKGADLSGQDLKNYILPKQLNNVSFISSQLPKDLSKTILRGSNLSNVDLSGCILPSDLSFTILEGTILPKNIEYIKFENART